MTIKEKLEFLEKHLSKDLQEGLDDIISKFVDKAKSDIADRDIEKAISGSPERKELNLEPPRTRPVFIAGFVFAMLLMSFTFLIVKDKPAPNTIEVAEIGVKEIPPELCDIKGNIELGKNGAFKKVYYFPTDPEYKSIAIDESAGEDFFCEIETAVSGGFDRP